MVDVIVKKTGKLSGEVCASPSKSYTQRMLISAALSSGTAKISNPLLSEDIEATLRAITALGAETSFEENCWVVKGAVPIQNAKQPIDCGESGATLRFMIPVAALAADPSMLLFKGSFARRPIDPSSRVWMTSALKCTPRNSATKTPWLWKAAVRETYRVG